MKRLETLKSVEVWFGASIHGMATAAQHNDGEYNIDDYTDDKLT